MPGDTLDNAFGLEHGQGSAIDLKDTRGDTLKLKNGHSRTSELQHLQGCAVDLEDTPGNAVDVEHL